MALEPLSKKHLLVLKAFTSLGILVPFLIQKEKWILTLKLVPVHKTFCSLHLVTVAPGCLFASRCFLTVGEIILSPADLPFSALLSRPGTGYWAQRPLGAQALLGSSHLPGLGCGLCSVGGDIGVKEDGDGSRTCDLKTRRGENERSI